MMIVPTSDPDLFAYTAVTAPSSSQKPADVGFLDRLFLTAVAVLSSSSRQTLFTTSDSPSGVNSMCL